MASNVSAPPTWSWRLADRVIRRTAPLAVGIVNVTSDSMYEGARSGTPAVAIEDGRKLAGEGFDMLDVGAVAARSGPPVPEDDEVAALVPAVEGLAGAGVPVSADTFVPEVARRALDAGAVAVNDIGGGSEQMFELAAERGCGLVLMHIEGPPREERPLGRYEDVVEHLKGWFADRLEAARERGVAAEQIVLDPGLDFDLGVEDGLTVLARLGELRELERPLYLSLSRKDFLGAVLAGSWEDRVPASGREWAAAAAAALAVAGGAEILRLHDASALQAVRIAGGISVGVRAEQSGKAAIARRQAGGGGGVDGDAG
ncbi:MAG: dihydropteroate synthase [Solirubrobacterales bacterium]